MASYEVYNVRMVRAGTVEAPSEAAALIAARSKHPGAVVARILTSDERAQKQYRDEVDAWEMMSPYL